MDVIWVNTMDRFQKQEKKKLKNKIFGITCHNSKKLATNAIKNNASYIAFGSFFKSKLKQNTIKANLNILRWAKKERKKTNCSNRWNK